MEIPHAALTVAILLIIVDTETPGGRFGSLGQVRGLHFAAVFLQPAQDVVHSPGATPSALHFLGHEVGIELRLGEKEVQFALLPSGLQQFEVGLALFGESFFGSPTSRGARLLEDDHGGSVSEVQAVVLVGVDLEATGNGCGHLRGVGGKATALDTPIGGDLASQSPRTV